MKQFLKPTPKKIILFILFFFFSIVPGPMFWPEGNCFMASGIHVFGIFFIFFSGIFKIWHLINPWMVCNQTLVNCSKELVNCSKEFIVYIFWLCQLISFILSYIVACLFIERPKYRFILILSLILINFFLYSSLFYWVF